MENKYYKGKYIGDSAVKFFDELAKLESQGDYKIDKKKYYKGRYQLGTDVLIDMGWASKGSTWENIKFIGEGLTKWKLKNKESFLNNPEAQDEVMMNSLELRWRYLKRYKDKICKNVLIPSNAIYKNPAKISVDEKKVLDILKKKRIFGYKGTIFKGKTFRMSSSGILASSHLCGQGAVGDGLRFNFLGKYGIPVDGNNVPFYFYHEVLGGYDLSVIIGFFEECLDNNVVLKNDSLGDKKNINQKAKDSQVSNTESLLNQQGIYEFNGQKYQEIWDSEEYKKDRKSLEENNIPKVVFIKSDDIVLERLKFKFEDSNLYNKDYIKYLEEKTGKKICENNKSDIELIIKIYDKATRDSTGLGNIIQQIGFDDLRGRGEKDQILGIQDILYYIFNNPIENKGKIETLEYVLSVYSARYIKYPYKKVINKKKIKENYELKDIDKIAKKIEIYKDNEIIEKLELSERYDKYLKGVKDIDEIEIKIKKIEREKFYEDRFFKLIEKLGESVEHSKSYEKDENGVLKFPLIRRLLDNIIIEFIKVNVNFKGENEIKYFDNHKYIDSNVVRNYILWFVKNYRKIDVNLENENGLFKKLFELKENIRVTTILEKWIESKSVIKVENIRKISSLIYEEYAEYTDNENIQNDKEILYKLFKNSKELRDYFANIDAMSIYTFYKGFYEIQNILNPDKTFYVNDNCILKCTLGEDISRLIIADDKVILRGGKQANIKDTNILPFKKCRIMNICKPQLLGFWEKNTEVKIRGEPALLDISTIKCSCGGIISIDDAGQKSVGIAKDKNFESSQNKKDVDCVYKLINNIADITNRDFMQIELKKKCQEFYKIKKEYSKLQSRAKQYSGQEFVNLIKGINDNRMLQNKRNEEIEKNKEKLSKLYSKVNFEKEKELKDKIYQVFMEANKKLKSESSPSKDTKGIIKKYGTIICDHDNKKFYKYKMFPVIAYGYLIKTAGLNVYLEEKIKIQQELNKDIEKINPLKITGAIGIYSVVEKSKKIQDKKKEMISLEEISKWLKIGEKLYSGIKNIPNNEEIVNKIREDAQFITKCPFNLYCLDKKNTNIGKEITLNKKEKIKNSDKEISDKKYVIIKAGESKIGKNKNENTIQNKLNSSEKINLCPNSNSKCKAPWIDIAYEELNKYKGKKENTMELGKRISETYFPMAKFGKVSAVKTAWCAAFVTYCILKSGYQNSSNPSVGGYDWGIAPRKGLPKRGWFEGEKTSPFVGAIGIFKHKNGYSHVAILIGEDGNGKYSFLGGNQNNEINITAYSKDRIDYFMKPKTYKVKEPEKILPIIYNSKKSGSIG